MSRTILRTVALTSVFVVGLLGILGTFPTSSKPSPGARACAGRDQQVKTGSVVQLDASCSDLRDKAAEDDLLVLS